MYKFFIRLWNEFWFNFNLPIVVLIRRRQISPFLVGIRGHVILCRIQHSIRHNAVIQQSWWKIANYLYLDDRNSPCRQIRLHAWISRCEKEQNRALNEEITRICTSKKLWFLPVASYFHRQNVARRCFHRSSHHSWQCHHLAPWTIVEPYEIGCLYSAMVCHWYRFLSRPCTSNENSQQFSGSHLFSIQLLHGPLKWFVR